MKSLYDSLPAFVFPPPPYIDYRKDTADDTHESYLQWNSAIYERLCTDQTHFLDISNKRVVCYSMTLCAHQDLLIIGKQRQVRLFF